MERFQSVGRLFLSLSRSCGSQSERTVSRAPRVPDLVASTLPRPYHFPAWIQSFQAVAAPFPGDSVLPSDPLAPRSGRNASVQKFAPDWAREAVTRPRSKRPDDLKRHPSTNLVSPKEKSKKNRRAPSEPPPFMPGLEQPRAGHPSGASAIISRTSALDTRVKPAHYEAEGGALIFGRRLCSQRHSKRLRVSPTHKLSGVAYLGGWASAGDSLVRGLAISVAPASNARDAERSGTTS